ncbi:patatin-like phospholipase family protein [Aquiflexum sp. TKW24L]|uniref:patatin-like phospholipase family protein n=1 Tax=Aquiflexum sp. TKW24L TaxID=2942212 RepID=UPI0020BF2104|nr:patatin-like phospholipase family protein [Aquiflexum sp. TKW24L]MCL6259867.1 patatin-like phospholipase family protein [Aquiflexum sp. TKW24L]
MKKVTIISIDGGGIRGIIPGTILALMEQKLQDRLLDPDARLVDYVDFVAGTSTGGILGCGMLMPSESNPKKPKYTLSEVVQLYLENGQEIFSNPFSQKVKSLYGLKDEKFSNTNLKKSLNDYFGDTLLSQLIRPCLFTSYDIEERKAKFFKHSKALESEAEDFYVRDLSLATSAAPTYFEAALIQSKAAESFPLIDGGVFANNPAMCAYAEVRKCIFDYVTNPTSKDMMMISIGTGSVKKPIPYKKAKNFGTVEWIKPLIDIMMSGNSETVSHQLEWLFDAGNNRQGYVRLEPPIGDANSDMANATKKNMAALKRAGVLFVQNNQEKIDEIITNLIENKS